MNAECLGESSEVEEAGIPQAPFEMTDVGPVQSGRTRQVFLRQVLGFTLLTDETAEFLEGGMGRDTGRHREELRLDRPSWP